MDLSAHPYIQYQDTHRIAILKNEIAGIDEYTYTYTDADIKFSTDFFGSWYFHSTIPLLYVTSQLQYILQLETELDEELRKSVDPLKLGRDKSVSKDKEKRRAAIALIKYLQKNIIKVDDSIKSNNRDPEKYNSTEFIYAHYTNTLLVRQILAKRLEREHRKVPDYQLYGSTADACDQSQFRDEVYVDHLHRKIAYYEMSHTQHLKEAFLKQGDKAIFQSNYLLAAIQHQKDELRWELEKPFRN